MSNQPLVSVVIPFHNHRQYINTVIENLDQQTYPHWEALLVDNNSNDGSAAIAQEVAGRHPQVRYLAEARQGIPCARNRGLRAASGKYVTFLDVDDEFIPTKLANHVQVLEANPEAAMVYGLTRRVYLPAGRSVVQASGVAHEGLNRPPCLAVDWLRTFYHLPQTGATLVRTDVAREIGGFDENLRLGNDDVAFHLKIAFKHNVWFQRREAVIYYRHSLSAGARLNRERGALERYLDAYQSCVIRFATEHEARTGDARPRYWAERALLHSMAQLAYRRAEGKGVVSRGRLLRGMLGEQRDKGYLHGALFRLQLELFAWLPWRQAKLTVRAVDKALSSVAPAKFPRALPAQA